MSLQAAVLFKAEGDEHTRARRFELAEQSYSLALAADPKQHATWGNRSLVRLKLGDLDGAASDAKKCTELAPDWPKGWARLGAAERARMHAEEASAAYKRAFSLEPSNKEYERLLLESNHEFLAQISQDAVHWKSRPSSLVEGEARVEARGSGTDGEYRVQATSWDARDAPWASSVVDIAGLGKLSRGAGTDGCSGGLDGLPATIPPRVTLAGGATWLDPAAAAELHRRGSLSVEQEFEGNERPGSSPHVGWSVPHSSHSDRRLADEARQIVPTLPIHDEHWCCSWTEALISEVRYGGSGGGIGGGGSGGGGSGGGGTEEGGGGSSESDAGSLGGGGGVGAETHAAPRVAHVLAVLVLSGPREGMLVGSDQSLHPPDGESVLDVLWTAMAFPMPSVPPPRRPAGVLLSARLMPHYAIIAGELLANDIACRLESRSCPGILLPDSLLYAHHRFAPMSYAGPSLLFSSQPSSYQSSSSSSGGGSDSRVSGGGGSMQVPIASSLGHRTSAQGAQQGVHVDPALAMMGPPHPPPHLPAHLVDRSDRTAPRSTSQPPNKGEKKGRANAHRD